MKEQELLRAIQNADRSFYEKAEQRMHHGEKGTMKNIVMHRIMTGAAAAAMLAVTVTGGIYLANKNNTGLTQPSAGKAATAPIEEQSTRIVTDARKPAVTAVTAVTAATAAPAAENLLGGHGSLRFAPNSFIMSDDEYWYLNSMDCVSKTNAGILPIEDIGSRSKIKDNTGFYTPDHLGSALYHIVYRDEKKGIYLVSDDGTERKLAIDNLSACFPDVKQKNMEAAVTDITRLENGTYFVSGYFYDEAMELRQESQAYVYFWEIYDTSTQTGHGYLNNVSEQVFSDGNVGVFTTLGTCSVTSNAPLLHCLPDGRQEYVLGETANVCTWFVYNNCIYYINADTTDYCKYDLNTKETTVLCKAADYATLYLSGNTLYTIKDQTLMYGDPDLTSFKEWKIEPLANTKYSVGSLYVEAVCDGDIIMRNVSTKEDRQNPDGTQSEVTLSPEYYIVYHPETGKAQYICAASAAPQTTEPVADTTTAPETTATTAETTTTTAAETAKNVSEKNVLGGRGQLQHNPGGYTLWDEDRWYESTGFCAEKSDAKYLPRIASDYDISIRFPQALLMDQTRGSLFTYTVSHNPTVYKLNQNNTEMFTNLFAPFEKYGSADDYTMFIENIAYAGHELYYITGSLALDNDDDAPLKNIWLFYDMVTNEAVCGELENGNGGLVTQNGDAYNGLETDYFADSNGNIYLAGNTWTNPTVPHINRIIRRTVEGKSETILEKEIADKAWFIYDDCIYYLAYGSTDYCKYNLATKETTVLMKNTGWDSIRCANGNVYAVKNGGTLVYGDADVKQTKEWKVEYPEIQVFAEKCIINGICDNVVFLQNQDASYAENAAMGVARAHDYTILYHTDTGKVQFIYNTEFYTPPAQ